MLRLTLAAEGGHIAELLDKVTNVSPLWIPPWKTMEHSAYSPQEHPEYGLNSESKLLAGILGHNLCLDLFGPPSDAEAEAGLTVHGEGSTAPYEFTGTKDGLIAKCSLKAAQLAFERQIRLESRKVTIRETVENLSAYDRPIAWQEHVTLGPPFLERGATQFRAPVEKATVMSTGEHFTWPHKPVPDGEPRDLRTYTNSASSAGFTAQLLDKSKTRSWAFAFSPRPQLVLGYVWQTADFPWLGMWEENHERQQPPWNGRTMTLGLEFGTTPFPETRRQMIERRELFQTPSFRWISAKSRLTVEYYAALLPAQHIPETLEDFERLLS